MARELRSLMFDHPGPQTAFVNRALGEEDFYQSDDATTESEESSDSGNDAYVHRITLYRRNHQRNVFDQVRTIDPQVEGNPIPLEPAHVVEPSKSAESAGTIRRSYNLSPAVSILWAILLVLSFSMGTIVSSFVSRFEVIRLQAENADLVLQLCLLNSEIKSNDTSEAHGNYHMMELIVRFMHIWL